MCSVYTVLGEQPPVGLGHEQPCSSEDGIGKERTMGDVAMHGPASTASIITLDYHSLKETL